MSRVILLNKPYGVLCQFRAVENRQTLKDFVIEPAVHPAGRLDADSEGLVALTDDGVLQNRISSPEHKLVKTYYAQVEGIPTADALDQLRRGVALREYLCKPAQAELVEAPDWLWTREPPVRFRKNIPTSWLKLSISEGKNRQVRHMTAAVGFPTLRLIRYAIGEWTIDGLSAGQYRTINFETRWQTTGRTQPPGKSPRPVARPPRRRIRS